MTLQKQDILMLEELIERVVRKVVQEEMTKREETNALDVSDGDKKIAEEIFREYKEVLDALA